MENATGILFLLALASANPAMAETAKCPIERAIYTQAGNDGVEAGFVRQGVVTRFASDLVFYVRNEAHTKWFGFSSPNGYGGTYIDEQIDPKLVKQSEADDETPDDTLPRSETLDQEDDGSNMLPFDAFDAKLNAYNSPPMAKDPAPAFLFSRELGPYLHYGLSGATVTGDRPLSVDIAFWRLTGCRKK